MRLSRRLPPLLALLTAALALVPQQGDPGPDPVSHPEWARMMLHGLDLDEALDFVGSAARAFAALSWRQSAWLDATQHLPQSAHGVVLERGTPVLLRAGPDTGEVSFPVTVARPGEYRVRVRMAGEPSRPATVEVAPLKGGRGRSVILAAPAVPEWIEAPNPIRLHPGAYRATFALPRGAALETLELVPQCIAPIEPLGGWQRNHVLDAEDLAVTLLKAADRERELPPADVPIETAAGETRGEADRPASARLTGGTGGGRTVFEIEVPVDGLYALSAFGVRAAGQRWAADDCRTAVTCPVPSRLPSWSPVMTAPFSAGRHRLTVDIGRGDSVDRVRLERLKGAGPDYVDAVRRMGFDPGEGPVSRPKAEEALAWLRKRHRIELSEICYEPGAGPVVERLVLQAPPSGEPLAEPPATPPCQPPASPVVPDPCAVP
jgi:hypothetical protein